MCGVFFLMLLQVLKAKTLANSSAENPDETSEPSFNIRAYRNSIKDSCVSVNEMLAVVNVVALAYFISTLFDHAEKNEKKCAKTSSISSD